MWTGKAQQAYTYLRNAIESGEFGPGQPLPEKSIVEQTGYSRTPIREAFRQLASEGLVVIEPRKAPYVSRISLQGTKDLFAFRRVIETAAIASVTSAAGADVKIKAAFKDIESDFKLLAKREKEKNFVKDFYKAASDFDDLILKFTPNRYITDSIVALKPHLSRVRRISKIDHSRLPQSIKEHIELCEAICGGNADKAISVMSTHLFHVENAVFQQLISGTKETLGEVEI